MARISILRSGQKEALFSMALFLIVLGLLSLTWFEGLAVSTSTIGAERVLRGEIPYRDFWTMYAPGHFYLLALLFCVFGTHALVEALAASLVCAAAGLVCYWLAFNVVGRRIAATACMAIFVAAMFNTGYFKSLGSYPPAIFFVLAALNFMVVYYQTEKLGYLIAAGLAIGAAIAFKHDVGGYTAIATMVGLVGYEFVRPTATAGWARSLFLKLSVFYGAVTVVALPVYLFFAVVAGKDLLQDLIIFPLTDFRFARPEHYPGLFELNLYGKSFSKALSELFTYISFVMPLALFFCGLIAIVVAARRHRPVHVALGVTFSTAYLLHYAAAHVQINTHIISLSVYGALLGLIFLDLLEHEIGFQGPSLAHLISLGLAGGWFLALATEPVDKAWVDQKHLTAELTSEKGSGLKVSPQLASNYSELIAFVNRNLRPDEHLFIGLHRHDVVIVGANAADYFLLNRPIATRYHEIHPGIADTATVQREIIRDLQAKNVALIILKRIKTDESLDEVKRDFLRNLPHIGATDLDDFIRANYVQVKEIRGNAIWQRKDKVLSATSPFEVGENGSPD